MGLEATALIVAAGSGQRLGADRPKALVGLAGRPLFEWSLAAFAAAGTVGPVLLAAPSGQLDRFERDGLTVVAGGASRSASVACGLDLVETPLVVVHDAARPFVTPELIDRTVGALAEDPDLDAVITALPPADTVKQVGPDGRVEATLDRSRLRLVQTPQVFRTDRLRAAVSGGDLDAATDDAALIEAAGGRVATVDGLPHNFKITVAADLERARLMLPGAGGDDSQPVS